MSGITASVGVYARGRYTRASDLNAVTSTFDIDFSKSLVSGTGNGACDLEFADTRTIAASGTDNLDLAGGVTDPFGNTLTFVDVKAIFIRASAANTNNLVIGNGTNPFNGPLSAAGTITLPPGGVLALIHPGAGWGVTGSTADVLKIANGGAGTSVDFDILVLGASA